MSDVKNLIAEGRAKLAAFHKTLAADQAFDVAQWAGLHLEALLDALEAAQPVGYVVLSKRPRRGQPDEFEYSTAGSIWPELDVVKDHRVYCEDMAEENPQYRAGEYVVAEVREVRS